MSDAEAARGEQRERWQGSAAGWTRSAQAVRRFGAPVSAWMIEQARLRPGHRVLELAAGLGETGFLAAELIAPGGTLTSSDASEGMLDGARARAAELGLENVTFRVLELEWIDEKTATQDAVLCRWGLMFPPDTETALREIRRVLKVGGRLAAATWAAPEHNQWALATRRALYDQGHVDAVIESGPGPFTLTDPERLAELARAAGLGDVEVSPVDVESEHDSFEDYWALQADLSSRLREVVDRVDERSLTALKAQVAADLEPFTDAGGALRIPGRALGLAAGA